ncbi:MAG: hypothetical protein GX926_01565 [Candidatus Magasanikbacteria bacterium]|nr:hypothetical protein [Candidatus Magasanikbacteria bacterium]
MNRERFNFNNIENSEYEETKEKEFIEKIEKAPLSSDFKIDLLLLVFDRKKATFLGDICGVESEEQKQKLIKEFSEELNILTNLLDELSLSYKIIRDVEGRNDTIGFSVVVAKEIENLNKIEEAVKNDNNMDMGMMFGYPRTAVEAYGTQDALDLETDLPEEYADLRKEGMLPFLKFAPSKLHWKEELKWARDNKKIIEEKSPNTIDQAIEEMEEYLNNLEKERMDKSAVKSNIFL